jgi:hypothetical protein
MGNHKPIGEGPGVASVKRKVVMSCAVTGAVHTPSISPYLPVTPDEIITTALGAQARRRGAASLCPQISRRQAGPARRIFIANLRGNSPAAKF